MSFAPKICISEASDASFLALYDSTGEYDAISNPDGYGFPNPEKDSITSVQLVFKFDDIPNNIILDFVTEPDPLSDNAIVVSGTKTDQLGNVTELDLSLYGIHLFPFPLHYPVTFPASFFFPNALVFADQYVEVTYTVSSGIVAGTDKKTFLLDQNSYCCLLKSWVKCSEGKIGDSLPIKIENAVNGLEAQNAVGNIAGARNEIAILKKLCASCGCGCG